MLWDIIRDWFVQYVFGGLTSGGDVYSGIVGDVQFVTGDHNTSFADSMTTQYGWFGLPNVWVDDAGDAINPVAYIGMGDWLSTTATIIVLCAMCIALFFVVKWLFKLFAGMISGVGR